MTSGRIKSRTITWLLPLAAAALLMSGCGGGGDAAAPAPLQAAVKPIAVGEPNGGNVDTGPFVKLAQEQQCGQVHNRLYLIDKQYVFHTRAGNCADNSYANTLYGSTLDKPLCTQHDSIAGPQARCSDEKARALFEVVVKNLDAVNLGLAASHEVKKIDVDGPVAFIELERTTYSGVNQDQNLVIKDAATFGRLWDQHAGDRKPAPRINFERSMVLAVFMGSSPSGCYDVRVVDVRRHQGKLLVVRQDTLPSADAICTMAFTSPAQLIQVERSDEPVEFVSGEALRQVDARSDSGVQTSRNVVIRDNAALAALWAEHAPRSILPPTVDFTKEMLVGVFSGRQPGCHGAGVAAILDLGDKLQVVRADFTPGPLIDCVPGTISQAHLVVVKRSDKPVAFSSRTLPLSFG